ncbi:hypothetical protein [Hymenobacter sp. BT730]|uniref:hypothetical protein n=1 Tax=Hymenobacter sp. BT730 TaxID=3063332 RepID=UPI0026E023B6|nr:hypothetical protein [Hymenobacter sp. BT730]
MPPQEPATRTITYRPDLEILLVRWHADAELSVWQEDYHTMLAVAQQHACARWLLDVRRREGTDPALSAWASQTFYPFASQQVAPQLLCLAILTANPIYGRFADDPAQRQYVEYMLAEERPFLTQVFDDEAEALRWLQAQ